MNHELRTFLIAVVLPTVLLATAGARLLYIEWRQAVDFTAMQARMKEGHPPPPRPEEMLFPQRGGPHAGPHRFHHPPPPPPHLVRIFSANYDTNGMRTIWIGGILLGMMVLALLSGSWRLMRSARRSRLKVQRQEEFLSNISHEFKTPLTALCICAELAQDDGIDPQRRKSALKAILLEAERLKRLVLNTLDLTRINRHCRTFCVREENVSEIVRETCAAFAPRFGEGRITGPEGDVFGQVDAEAFRLILANLLDNAATHAAGTAVSVEVTTDGTHTRVSVSDNGPGLDADGLRHAFDRFWRGAESVACGRVGSGLGLAIAHGLARGMGGDLTVANRPEGGAVFTMEVKA